MGSKFYTDQFFGREAMCSRWCRYLHSPICSICSTSFLNSSNSAPPLRLRSSAESLPPLRRRGIELLPVRSSPPLSQFGCSGQRLNPNRCLLVAALLIFCAPLNHGIRDRTKDDASVLIRDRKVRTHEKASLYGLCRSWLRNGFPEETQKEIEELAEELRQPLPGTNEL